MRDREVAVGRLEFHAVAETLSRRKSWGKRNAGCEAAVLPSAIYRGSSGASSARRRRMRSHRPRTRSFARHQFTSVSGDAFTDGHASIVSPSVLLQFNRRVTRVSLCWVGQTLLSFPHDPVTLKRTGRSACPTKLTGKRTLAGMAMLSRAGGRLQADFADEAEGNARRLDGAAQPKLGGGALAGLVLA